MVLVTFIYKGGTKAFEENTTSKMKEIFRKFSTETKVNLESIIFLYKGEIINKDSELKDLISDINQNEIKILTQDNNNNEQKVKSDKIISKYPICPECGEIIRINIKDYKINLFECDKGHEIKGLTFEKYIEIQKLDETKIICDSCENTNKAYTYENKFYKCLSCKMNLCPICKSHHDKSHGIILYDEKDFNCQIHNDIYNSYCNNCKKNICIECEHEHDNHDMISLGKLFPNKNYLTNYYKELKGKIDQFNEIINEIINRMNEVVKIMNIYYKIVSNHINNYQTKNRNYQILQNINDFQKNKIILDDITKIVNENDITIKIDDIFRIYNRIKDKKENFAKTNENMNTINKSQGVQNKYKQINENNEQKYLEIKSKYDELKKRYEQLFNENQKAIEEKNKLYENLKKRYDEVNKNLLKHKNAIEIQDKSVNIIQNFWRTYISKAKLRKIKKIREILLKLIIKYSDIEDYKKMAYFQKWRTIDKLIKCQENARIIQYFCIKVKKKVSKIKLKNLSKKIIFRLFKNVAKFYFFYKIINEMYKRIHLYSIFNLAKTSQLYEILENIFLNYQEHQRENLLRTKFHQWFKKVRKLREIENYSYPNNEPTNRQYKLRRDIDKRIKLIDILSRLILKLTYNYNSKLLHYAFQKWRKNARSLKFKNYSRIYQNNNSINIINHDFIYNNEFYNNKEKLFPNKISWNNKLSKKIYLFKCLNTPQLSTEIYQGTNEAVIKIILKNNGKEIWPKKNTKLITDIISSSLTIGDIILEPQKPGEQKEYYANFQRLLWLPVGEYKSYLYFYANNEFYGEKLALTVKIKKKDKTFFEIKENINKINKFRKEYDISEKDYPNERILKALKKYEFNFPSVFASLFTES